MNEDEVVNNLVKSGLEEGVALRPEVLRSLEQFAEREARARRWNWRLWPAGFLVAASLALVVLFRGILPASRPVDDLSEIRNAVGLLCAVDGIEENLSSFPADEMLLAWQDAPCAGLL